MNAKRGALVDALRVAAEKYEADADSPAVHDKLREQFKRQAQEAFALADMIQQADTVHLED